MRRLQILCFVLTLAVPVLAGTVSREEARLVGERWLATRGEEAALIGGDCRPLTDPERDDALLGFHLPLQPRGFLIVSARRELPALKAFSFDTNFDPADADGASALLIVAAVMVFLLQPPHKPAPEVVEKPGIIINEEIIWMFSFG